MVTVNSKVYDDLVDLSIVQVIKKLDLKAERGVAIAVNNAVIPRQNWEEVYLKENDKVLLIRATQGG